MRVVTITLNAAIDTTYVVDGFRPGSVVRPVRQYDMPGGKGNNVARVLASLGHDVVATGFIGGATGDAIIAGLRGEGIQPAFATLDGRASRTCIAILDETSGVVTEVLEAGPTVGTADYDRLLSILEEILPGADAVVISGSAPAGSSASDLERVATAARSHGAGMIVDSSGSTLEALLRARPDVIKPNEVEIDALIGGTATIAERIRYARDTLLAGHLSPGGLVLLTLGAEGGALVHDAGVLMARIPAGKPVNTVGCGDAALAGLVDAVLAERSPGETLRRAMAFGAAAARQPVAGIVDPADVAALVATIDISPFVNDRSPAQRS